MENGVPHYLKEYLVVKEHPKTLNDEFVVKGRLRCACGGEAFIVYRDKYIETPEQRMARKKIDELCRHYAQGRKPSEDICIGFHGENTYIMKIDYAQKCKKSICEDITELWEKEIPKQVAPQYMEAVCPNCGKKILVFNSAIHGYDGIIDSERSNYKKEFPLVKKRKCRKCGAETYQIELHISNTGKDDLIREAGKMINDSNWEDAFDWLRIDLICSGCGQVSKKYFDVETM